LLCEALRGRRDGRYGRQRQGGEQVAVQPGLAWWCDLSGSGGLVGLVLTRFCGRAALLCGWDPGGRDLSLGSAPKDLGGCLVGRQERLQVQLGEGDVGRGRERRQGGDEPQLALVAAQASGTAKPMWSGPAGSAGT
jgi:hypothetical protein